MWIILTEPVGLSIFPNAFKKSLLKGKVNQISLFFVQVTFEFVVAIRFSNIQKKLTSVDSIFHDFLMTKLVIIKRNKFMTNRNTISFIMSSESYIKLRTIAFSSHNKLYRSFSLKIMHLIMTVFFYFFTCFSKKS